MTDPRRAPEPLRETNEKLIVALDVDSAGEARRVVDELSGLVDTFKVGLQLFSAAGGGFIRELVDRGVRVFLDLKFHDIPNTTSLAGIEAARLGVWMFNVHASGGGEMMKRTVEGVGEFCERGNLALPHIIGVTVLTSSDAGTLRETGIDDGVEEQVVRLARLSADSGLHGVVASPNEIGIIRSATADKNFLIVTPGIRPLTATNDDQKRVMTPGEAISRGADYLVVGRPILAATDRPREASLILREMSASRQ